MEVPYTTLGITTREQKEMRDRAKRSRYRARQLWGHGDERFVFLDRAIDLLRQDRMPVAEAPSVLGWGCFAMDDEIVLTIPCEYPEPLVRNAKRREKRYEELRTALREWHQLQWSVLP
jgi:hypothetical protein